MRRRESIAGLFVVVMLALGGAIMLHWRSQQARPDEIQNPGVVEWRPATAQQYAAAKQTIAGQLDAFRTDDFRKATIYQSQMLRLSFQSIDNFRSQITTHYPEFCHFATFEFGTCLADQAGNTVRMQVLLLSKQGQHTRALYFLDRENGMYRVAQVVPDTQDFRSLNMPFHPPPPGSYHGGDYDGPLPPPQSGPSPYQELDPQHN